LGEQRADERESNGKSAELVERVDRLSLDLDKDVDESGDAEDDDSHTPTTAERRKMFEEHLNQTEAAKRESREIKSQEEERQEEEEEEASPIQEENTFLQPTPDESNMTIAERRRLYESRYK